MTMMNSIKIGDLSPIYKPLKSRFYILLTFCLFNFLSGWLWNAWSPLMNSIKALYGWGVAEINFQSNLSSIIFCIFAFPFIYVWNRRGIRFIYYMSTLMFVMGTFLRLYPGTVKFQSIALQIGSVIASFGGIMPSIGPPVISMLWFPSHERARATATAISFNSLGTALSPIIASKMVPDLSHNNTGAIEAGIKTYMFVHCCLAILVTGMVVIYFPERPPILPCKSSEISLRLELWPGCKVLMRNKQFWIVFLATAIIYGVNSALSVVAISYTLPMGISQTDFGVLSSVVNLFTFVSVLMGGWLGDRFSYKSIIYASVPPSIIMYCVTGFQCLKLIPHSLMSLYIVNSIQNLSTNFACPVLFEMGCEAAFPVSEEVVTMMLSYATNIGIIVFLGLCSIQQLGTTWIPFSYALLCALLVPLMWFYKDERNRMKYDDLLSTGDVIRVIDDTDDVITHNDRSALLG